MGINESHLHRDENIVLDLHPHWIMLAEAVFAVVVSLAIGIFLITTLGTDGMLNKGASFLGGLLILGSLAYLARKWVQWYSTNFVVTTDRCIYREGVVSKRGIEIPLERINTIFFNQGIIDRMVGAGTLIIESAGETGRQEFEDVRDPVGVQNTIYQEMEDNENRKFDRVRAPAAAASSPADEIAKLAALRDQGHLTEAEFQAQKAKLLGQAPPPPQPPPNIA